MMSKKNTKRWEVYLFDAAHGTNPAEATFSTREKAAAYAVRLRRESVEYELYGVAPDYRIREVAQ